MDLVLDLLLVVPAFLGGLVAIVGKPWNAEETTWHKRLTPTGKLSVACILLTFVLGIAKAVQTYGSSQTSEKRAGTQAELISEVVKLQLDKELITEITFSLDASFPDNNQPNYHNNLRALYKRITKHEIPANHGVGIHAKIFYGGLGIHIYGVYLKPESRERWFVKVLLEGRNRRDYWATDPIEITDQVYKNASERDFNLAQGIVAQAQLDVFFSRPSNVVDLVRRTEYKKELFDPGFELGNFSIVVFKTLRDDIDPFGFAKDFSKDHRPAPTEDAHTLVNISEDDIRQWIVSVSINRRKMFNLSADRWVELAVKERFQKWNIMDQYRRKNRIVISPDPKDWSAFKDYFNANVRELLFGVRGSEKPQELQDVIPPWVLDRAKIIQQDPKGEVRMELQIPKTKKEH
jgi:hypothetical protein